MALFVTACLGSIFLLVNAFAASVSSYRAAPLFLLPMIWAPYWLQKPLHLRPLHYGLFVAAVALHDLGAYGFYQHSPLPFSFDIAVHFYFAFAVAFAVHWALEANFVFRGWQTYAATLLFMMGCGALHEVMEYMTYLFLGEERGMLKPSSSYFFDTQRDLTNNLLGTLLALLLITVTRWIRQARSAAHRTEQEAPSNGQRRPRGITQRRS